MALHFTGKTAQQPQTQAAPVAEHKPKMAQQMQELQEFEAKIVAAVDSLQSAVVSYQEANAKQLTDNLDKAKKHLMSIASDEFEPGEQAYFVGSSCKAVFSSKPETTQFSLGQMEALLQKLGPQLFCSVVKISVTDLKKVMSEQEIDQFSSKEYGSRRFVGIQPL